MEVNTEVVGTPVIRRVRIQVPSHPMPQVRRTAAETGSHPPLFCRSSVFGKPPSFRRPFPAETAKKTRQDTDSTEENTREVGFMEKLKRQAPRPVKKYFPFAARSPAARIPAAAPRMHSWHTRVAVSLFAVMAMFMIPGVKAQKAAIPRHRSRPPPEMAPIPAASTSTSTVSHRLKQS